MNRVLHGLPSVLLPLLAACVAGACEGVARTPADALPDAADVAPVDVAPVDVAPPDVPKDPGTDADFDPGMRPACCTDALCAALQATCDPATCRCVPGSACCTAESCAGAGMACDPGTCRCERVPCTKEGDRCDDARVPGDVGRLVCTATPVGLFCLRHVDGWSGCPGGVCGAWDGDGCTCGWTGCTPFEDFCDDDQACQSGAWAPLTTGTCGTPGTGRQGEACSGAEACAAGLACLEVCETVECGIGPGAPSCPAGESCRPLDAWGVMGTCRVPCDVFDPAGPCAFGEWCRGPCAYLEPAAFCDDPDVPTYGLLGGWCTPIRGGIPAGAGEPCLGRPCGPGLLCAGGVCLEACPAGLAPGTARGAAACAPGLECAPVQVDWPVYVGAGVCAPPCDPFAVPPDAACEIGRLCRMSAFAAPALGHCLPGDAYSLAAPGKPCHPTGLPCGGGYACMPVGPRRSALCEPACLVDAAPGDARACPAGRRCFPQYDFVAKAFAPWGACAAPCDPFADAEAAGCPAHTDCEPRDRDPATGRLVGMCFDRDSGAEGQPCASAEPGMHPGCGPGLVCRPEGGGSRCRVRCDVQANRTGQGACPDGQSCLRAWPPTGDPVMAGCVTE